MSGYFTPPDKKPAPTPTEYELERRRPTVTRTLGLGVLLGPIGAIVGLAWRKKERTVIRAK